MQRLYSTATGPESVPRPAVGGGEQPAERATVPNRAQPQVITYEPARQRERDLRNAVSGVALTDRDERLIEWLAQWHEDTTDALADLIARARHALIGPVR